MQDPRAPGYYWVGNRCVYSYVGTEEWTQEMRDEILVDGCANCTRELHQGDSQIEITMPRSQAEADGFLDVPEVEEEEESSCSKTEKNRCIRRGKRSPTGSAEEQIFTTWNEETCTCECNGYSKFFAEYTLDDSGCVNYSSNYDVENCGASPCDHREYYPYDPSKSCTCIGCHDNPGSDANFGKWTCEQSQSSEEFASSDVKNNNQSTSNINSDAEHSEFGSNASHIVHLYGSDFRESHEVIHGREVLYANSDVSDAEQQNNVVVALLLATPILNTYPQGSDICVETQTAPTTTESPCVGAGCDPHISTFFNEKFEM